MIQLVLDTNVFVSALFWAGPPRKILEAWGEQKIQLILSTEIMQEYTRIAYALSHKRNLAEDAHVAIVLEIVAIYGKFVSPVMLDRAISRDPDDDKFLACAIGAGCQLIISGDKDLLDISGSVGINVCTPGQFVKIYL